MLAESDFDVQDMSLRRCPFNSMKSGSAVSRSIRSIMLSLGDHVARRQESRKPKEEAFARHIYWLPEKEQEALVELARPHDDKGNARR